MAKRKGTKLHEWQNRAKKGGRCTRCRTGTDYLTVDHIVPKHLVEQLDVTGLAVYEDEENFQLLCPPCNKFKAQKVDIRDERTKKILRKLLDN